MGEGGVMGQLAPLPSPALALPALVALGLLVWRAMQAARGASK